MSRGVAEGESVWVRAERGETRTECVFSSFCLLSQNNNDKDIHYILFCFICVSLCILSRF